MGYSPWGCKESATTERRGNAKQGSYERVLVLAPELASRRPWLSAVNVAPARRVSGLPGWLTVTPFPAQVLAAEENVDFRIHVENQTRARDDVSRKQLRLYQLYSRTSGKHIQVLGRRISARGEDGDKYGRCQPLPAPLCASSWSLRPQVQIPARPDPGCVVLHPVLSLSGPQFPHLWNGGAEAHP